MGNGDADAGRREGQSLEAAADAGSTDESDDQLRSLTEMDEPSGRRDNSLAVAGGGDDSGSGQSSCWPSEDQRAQGRWRWSEVSPSWGAGPLVDGGEMGRANQEASA